MLDKIIDLFRGVRSGIEVVEVNELYDPRLDDEASIQALATHPGFVALTNRWKLRAALLQTKLNKGVHTDLYQVYNLQNGLEWYNSMKAEVDKVVLKKKEAKAVAALPEERAQFDQVLALIQSV